MVSVITSAVSVALLVLAVVYIIWLRHTIRNLILTNNGLFKALNESRETGEAYDALVNRLSTKNSQAADMIAELDIPVNLKTAIITRLKG